MRPGDAHAVHGAGGEILDQHITGFDQFVQDLFALGLLGVQRDGALVVVEHGEVQAVHTGDVAQLAARGIAFAGALYLDHIGAKPGQQLGAGRPGLDVREIKDADAI